MTALGGWGHCHALLEQVLDMVEAGDPGWQTVLAHLELAALEHADYPSKRWSAGAGFGLAEHRALDSALRCDGVERSKRLDGIRWRVTAKFRHQVELTAYVPRLAEACRALGKLEADVADPLVALRDALLTFDVVLAKTELRELLRQDKYHFQRTDTRGHPLLTEIWSRLTAPEFDLWPLETELATCGAVAQGHPERFTWFLDDGCGL